MKILLLLLVLIFSCSKKTEKLPVINPKYKKIERQKPISHERPLNKINEVSPAAKIETPVPVTVPDPAPVVEKVKEVDLPQMKGFQASTSDKMPLSIQTKPGGPAALPQMGGDTKIVKDKETLPKSVPGGPPALPRSGQ